MKQQLLIIISLMIGTLITRFLPFVIFPVNKETPKYITYLSSTLPFAIIGLLVIYCMKEVTVLTYPFALPELISILLIIILHNWKRNSLLSIGAGTVCYMLLVQTIFA